MTDDPDQGCPVDHRARDAWLAQARAAQARAAQASDPRGGTNTTTAQCPIDEAALSSSACRPSWTQTLAAHLPWYSPPSSTQPPPKSATTRNDGALDTGRAVSGIPRFSPGPAGAARGEAAAACPVEHAASAKAPVAANHEIESGADAASGNWVYPSERMFFDAMKRKGYDARVADMKTVVPIHNAVNERAWKEIQQWEAPYLEASGCGGPKLESFANKNTRMTPTARLNTILGYTPPFDRHDWVIDRCGTRVEYVIDFYAGRPGGRQPGPSFYLDVRPKLNTWEGVKMRAWRWTGMA